MIKKLIRAYLADVLALYFVSTYISGFHLADGYKSLLLVALGLTIIHIIIKPLLGLITGPLNFLTLGLFGFVLDGILLFGLTTFFPQVWITAWTFPGFFTANITIDPIALPMWAATIVCAFVINLVRSSIMALCDS